MDKAGLTQAETIEYKITPPSYHSINEAINKDIAKLRDHRWPYTKGGRKPVMPTPVPDSMKTRPAKEPSLTVAARSNPFLSFPFLSFSSEFNLGIIPLWMWILLPVLLSFRIELHLALIPKGCPYSAHPFAPSRATC